MDPASHFHFCPRCGRPASEPVGARPFRCSACGFRYFFNAAVSAAAIIQDPRDRTLFIRRAKEPGKGKLAFVGGFVDPGESVEEALGREVREEVNLELRSMTYLTSCPNPYRYDGVVYPVADLYFVCRTDRPETARALDGVDSFCWLDARTVSPEDIAFPSMQVALARFIAAQDTSPGQRR